ncbi:hypothetical protein Tco_1125359 [Tanacetum coccineum]|uniref:Uncharacterized protein n=1 Tax=Tanacetum coccineum TaxID=301880 RepID=A0ABQ5J9B9_9ASTR
MKAIFNLNVPVDYKAPKPSSQIEEVPQGKKPGAKSKLKRKQSSKHTSESKTKASKSKTGQSEKENQSSSAKEKSPSYHLPSTPVVGEMHKEAQQEAGDPTSLGATSEEGAHPQLSSGYDALAYSTAKADPRLSAPNDSIPLQKDKSKEEEEVARDKDTKSISHDVPKDTSVLPPSSPKSTQIQELMAQLTELLVTSLKPNLSKLLASHNFTSCLPTELKELLSKITRLSGEIKELKKHVRDIEIELPEDLKEILTKLETFTSIISCLSTHSSFFSSRKPQDFRFSSKSFHILTDTLNRFATMVENVSGATSMNVPLVVKNVVTQYYTKKLFFDKCCDKMLKRKKSPKITKCELLTKKGRITLKIYREDGSDELISNIKVSDLHSGEWREVIQACPNKSEKGWKTIDDLVKTRLESSLNPKLNKNLRLDFNKPRKEQDPL